MASEPSRISRLWHELKRRRVTRVISIYAVVGLGIIEAMDIIGGRFQISEGTIQFMIILILAGFPIALILGWIYDLTTKGIERTDPLTPEERAALPALTWRPSWISVMLFFMLISLALVYFTVPRANALGFQERDWILMADLENNTDDEMFDRSLMHALSVTIDQSKHINIFPRRRLKEVLQRMQLDSVDKIDVPLALEIAERENIKAVLSFSISEIDNTYLMISGLMDPYTGESIRSRQVKAEGKEEILWALDELATTVRRDLGESLGQVLTRKVPLVKATTPSLEALKLYTDGANAWSNNRGYEAQTLWNRAIEIDSGFAWVNASLGLTTKYFQGEIAAQKYFDRALGQLDRVTQKERLWITALATSGQQSIEAYKTYLQQYPDDRDAWYNLGNQLRPEARMEEAIEAYERSLALDPDYVWGHSNLAGVYDLLGQYREAATHFEKAFQLDPTSMEMWNGDVNRISGFVLVKTGNVPQARERFELLLNKGDANRANGLRSIALLEMYLGNHISAVELLKEAVVINQRSNAPESEFRNRMYLIKAYQSLGMDTSRDQELIQVQDLIKCKKFAPYWTMHLVLRLVDKGDILSAQTWLDSLVNSEKTITYREWIVELVRGEIALAEGNFSEAVTSIELADQLHNTKYGLIKEALGRAYYANGQLDQAEALFLETIQLMQLGFEPQEPWVLAHYRLALLLEEMGKTEASRQYLEKFLELWGSGDEGLTGVADARRRLKLTQ